MDPIDEFIAKSFDYAREKGFNLNPDKEALSRLATGIIKNEEKYGVKYCPCRRVTGNREEDARKICPCAFHLEEIESQGHCLCRLFWK